MDEQNTNKHIVIETTVSKKTKKVTTEKPKKQRVFTKKPYWATISDQLVEQEACGLYELLQDDDTSSDTSKLISQQVRSKISGYASQDRLKGLYLRDQFVQFQQILDLFRETEMKCYYCKETTQLLYEHVREPKQWTLERLDNSLGHNHGNVVIACLKCNLRRRTMASERYVKTKAMSKIVKVE